VNVLKIFRDVLSKVRSIIHESFTRQMVE